MEQGKTLTSSSTLQRVLVSPYLALMSAALFWSGNFIVGRALRGDVPPISLNFWRWMVALIILLPLSYGQLRRHQALLKTEWKIIVGLGLTGIATFHICVYVALTSTTAINALLFLSTAPVAIVIGSWLVFRDTITVTQAVGVVISLVGAVVVIGRGNLETVLGLQFNRGDVWMILAVLLWAAYSILLKRRPAQLPQLALLTGSVIAGLLWMLPVYIAGLWMGQQLSINGPNVLGILYIGIFASVLAFLFWNRGVAQIGPNRAGMFIHLMPIFGAVLSIVFLGEGLALYHIVGAIFVFVGIVFSTRQHEKILTKYQA